MTEIIFFANTHTRRRERERKRCLEGEDFQLEGVEEEEEEEEGTICSS